MEYTETQNESTNQETTENISNESHSSPTTANGDEIKQSPAKINVQSSGIDNENSSSNPNVPPEQTNSNLDVPEKPIQNLSASPSSFSSSSSSTSAFKIDSSSTSASSSPNHQNVNEKQSRQQSPCPDIPNHNIKIENEKSTEQSETSVQPTMRKSNTMACEMCNNYEIQLQDIQYREAILNLKISQNDNFIKKLKEDLKKEQTFRLELEEKYNEESKNFESNIKNLSDQVDQGRSKVEKMTIDFNKMEKRANDLVADLISQIETLKKEIQRISSDNEKLIGRHLKKSQEMSSESISLPEDLESLQFYCLQLRENLIQALCIKEHLEETLRSENMFLKEQLLGEQQSKENIEESFSHENEILSSKVHVLEKELNDSKKHNDEMKSELELIKGNYNKLSSTSTKRIQELEDKVKELLSLKARAESDIATLKGKVQTLQIDLTNSEQVQRDFVKLSQSLQVQLEKIRQADTEVRWQHEEDVTECNGCKKTFHSRKEKMNCNHCGKIFCQECCSKVIRNGPKMRQYKVCQVCHTLLDNQTACWFVNEAPKSPT